jgi:FkbH-like protein
MRSRDVISPVDRCLTRAEWQSALFADRLRRLDLTSLECRWATRPVKLRVWRNHAFEFVAHVMQPFLQWSGLSGQFAYGDYDDSLGFERAIEDIADVEIVWLDFARYRPDLTPEALGAWLAERLTALRGASAAPMLVADWAGPDRRAAAFNQQLPAALASVVGCHVCAQGAIYAELGAAYFDPRASSPAGSPLSNAAMVATARRFGLQWLPALCKPTIKAVVVDLDNTLYEGVVGEDGPRGVRFGEDHRALITELQRLRERGVMLTIASKNQREDVQRLFEDRAELGLRLDDFSVTEVSWRPKSESIQDIAKALRVSTESILFIDDNPGELAAAAAAAPQLETLCARPGRTAFSLQHYPGIFRWVTTKADAVRIHDLGRAADRDALLVEAGDDLDAYLRTLAPRITFALDPVAESERIHQLAHKTNQFILALRRFTAAEIADRLKSPTAFVVTVALRDRLSDSGNVAVLIAQRDGVDLRVEELCISCRALGRRLERPMIFGALLGIARRMPSVRRIGFDTRPGDRNEPARTWLQSCAAAPLGDRAETTWIDWDQPAIEAELAAMPVDLQWELG